MELDSAHSLIATAIGNGRIAHGYLVIGGLRGTALELAKLVLSDLFPGIGYDGLKKHPDIHWIYPELKSRIVSVSAIHEKLIAPVSRVDGRPAYLSGLIV